MTALDDPLDGAARRRLCAGHLDALRAVVRARGGRAALLRTRANVAWATAGAQHHVVTSSAEGVGALLVNDERAWFLAPNIEAARLREEELGESGLDIVEHDWWATDGLERNVVGLLGGDTTGLLSDGDLDSELRARRSLLDPRDHERLARLGAVAVTAVEGALAEAHPDMTEDELAAGLLAHLPGVRAPVVLVAADDRIARFRHPLPTSRRIRDRVMLVLVAEGWGLHVALTRFRSWRPDGDDLQRRWSAVRRVQDAMYAASGPGATLGDVFAVARRAYADEGYPEEWRDHHQGGIIAYEGRERVALPDDPTTIESGMALAWNPSIAGVKVEDTIIVGDDGHTVVTELAVDAVPAGGRAPT